MRKKGLEQKIILALCLGIALYTPVVYAADVTLGERITERTNTTDLVKGYETSADNQNINTTNGSIAAKVDNSGWSNVTDANAVAYGFYNNGHTGILLQGGTEYFPITAKATGGSAASAIAYAFGIYGYNSTTTINANTIINATATGGSATATSAPAPAYAYASASGISGNHNSTATINGNTTINATAKGGSATATAAHASAYGIFDDDSTTTINGNTIINATAKGGSATSAYAYAYGIAGFNNSTTTINGNTTINATATGGNVTSADAYAYAYGIVGLNNSKSTITGNTTINATATGGVAASATGDATAKAFGIYGDTSSTTTINGNITIQAAATGGSGANTGAWAYALYGRDGAKININQTAGNPYTVQVTGDVAANNGSTINLSLSNSHSFLRGNVLTDSSSAVNFTVANGAVWQPVYDNRNGSFYFSPSAYSTNVNTINQINLSNSGSIDLTWDNTTRSTYRTLNIGTLNGNNGIIKVNTNLAGNTGDTLATTTNHATNLGAAITYDPIMESISGVGYHEIGAGTYSPVSGGSSALSGVTSEHKEYSYVPVLSGTNTITGLNLGVSTNTKAAVSAASGQSQIMQTSGNHLRKRLGDLRESPETENGVWARIYNGQITNDKYNKIETDYNGLQVGYDNSKQVKDGRMYNGAAFSYTNADNTFNRGTGNDKAYDVALYKTWLGNSGHYYDIIAKRGKIDSTYQVTDISNNHSTANYKTWTDSLSAEYGYKKQLNNGWYIEPQAELTYGHIDGADYTTSTGMQVKQGSINRLIGRMGMGVGRKLNNGNHIYTSLSMLHEFQGDEKIQAGTLNNEQDMSGTWYEFILGTTEKLSDHSNGYVNVEKLFGKDVSSNWQLNAGCRFSF